MLGEGVLLRREVEERKLLTGELVSAVLSRTGVPLLLELVNVALEPSSRSS